MTSYAKSLLAESGRPSVYPLCFLDFVRRSGCGIIPDVKLEGKNSAMTPFCEGSDMQSGVLGAPRNLNRLAIVCWGLMRRALGPFFVADDSVTATWTPWYPETLCASFGSQSGRARSLG